MKTRYYVLSLLTIFSFSAHLNAEDNSAKSALQQLAPFAPESTEMVSIVRHGLLSNNDTIRQGIEGALSYAVKELPIPLTEFDEFFALSNPVQHSRQTFEAVANDLNETNENQPTTKTPVDNFAGFVRFKDSVDWTKMESMLNAIASHKANVDFADVTESNLANEDDDDEETRTAYHLVKWQDKEFLYTEDANAPCALRVDDRSFILCNYGQLRDGLAHTSSNDAWYNSISEDDLRGDIVTVVNVGSNPEFAKRGPLALLQNTSTVIVRFDLSNATLASVRLFFKDGDSAKSFVDAVKGMHGLSKATIKEQLEKTVASRGEDENAAWIAGQFESIYTSVQFDQTDATATITVPRPDQFDAIVEKVAGVVKSERLAAEKALAELQQAADASSAEAVEAIESLEVKSVD
jgi:hypothetical protein